MGFLQSFQISASGMAVEKLRLDLTAANLANMHGAAARPEQVYQPLRLQEQAVPLQFGRQFDQLLVTQGGGTRVTGVTPLESQPRLVYEPGHPYADAKGFVAYPAVDQAAEMLNLNIAMRTYEANVVAMNAAKTMAGRTLDLWRQG